jgi:AcrR family transcriptional regulator
MPSANRSRLNQEDWTAAALTALEQGGLAAVAIEPLAAALGATKGSGYWHFANRADLVAATLKRWEEEHTAAVIAQIERGGSPEHRLRELMHLVMAHAGANAVELSLLASADDPDVAAALARVSRARLEYLAKLFRELGLDRAAASRRALLAYTTYLGHAQLARSAPSAVPADTERDAYLDSVLALLLQPAGPAR